MQADPRNGANKAPVLFLIFNRPEPTRRVFEAIRRARPVRLYVAADGPRDAVPTDHELCRQAREITELIDWPCEVKRLYRDKNLGCRAAVSSAITRFFEQEERGIILEDDCLPEPSFFPFCEELLERYQDDESVYRRGIVELYRLVLAAGSGSACSSN
jgi:hypothetical protein